MNKRKTFNLLLIAQSLSAFGDNAVYSTIMGILLGFVKAEKMTLMQFGINSAIYANCLFLPFVILSPVVGWISDRFEKRSVLIFANLIKSFGCLTGLAGIIYEKNLLIISYMIIGVGAAVYSPSKYGIIPELKSEADLVKANAAIEMTTIMSILFGIIAGGLLIDNIGAKNSYIILLIVFLTATVLNYCMDKSKISNKDEFLLSSLKDFNITIKDIFNNKLLIIPVIGTAIFWASASFVKLNLQTWGQAVLKLGTATKISLLALWLSIGIVLGSFIAGKKFKTGQIKQSWLFGFGMGIVILFMIVKYFSYSIVTIELIVLGMLGGIFLIPLNAEIQAKSAVRNIGKVIAIQNLFENTAMLLSSGLFWYLNKISISSIATFIVIGCFLCFINIFWLKPVLKKT